MNELQAIKDKLSLTDRELAERIGEHTGVTYSQGYITNVRTGSAPMTAQLRLALRVTFQLRRNGEEAEAER